MPIPQRQIVQVRPKPGQPRSLPPKEGTKAGDILAYCMKCKTTRAMDNVKHTVTDNGVNAVKGKCRTCGSGMYKFLGKKAK